MALNVGIVRSNGLNKWEMQGYEYLPANKINVAGICSKDNKYDTSKIRFPTIKLNRFGFYNKIPLISNGLQYFFPYNDWYLNFNKITKEFDLLHSIDPFYPFSYQCAKSGKPSIFTYWENIPFNNERFAYKKFKRYVYKYGNHFIAVTPKSEECMLKEGVDESKISIIYPGIDLDLFKPGKKDKHLMDKYGIEKDSFLILFSGRLVHEKGIFYLLKAFKQLYLKNKNIKLLMLGKGPLKNKILDYTKRNLLHKNIILSGFMEYTETYKLYNLSDVFCVPSIPLYSRVLKWEEQFGYVFAEAMACRKPIISTISGSIPDVVGDGGILVKPNNSKELFDALLSLYKDESLRNNIGKNAFKIAKQRYDSKIMSKKLAKLYYSLIK
jgi:glycosyltransferase involved in cell wall biosynthesis